MPAEFRREDRYTVIKNTDADKASHETRRAFSVACRKLHDSMLTRGAPARSFLVIESDWPEYEPAWAMIEARVTGQPPALGGQLKCWSCKAIFSLQDQQKCDGCCWKCGVEIELDDYMAPLLVYRDQFKRMYNSASESLCAIGEMLGVPEEDQSVSEVMSACRSLMADHDTLKAQGKAQKELLSRIMGKRAVCLASYWFEEIEAVLNAPATKDGAQ